MSEDPVTGMITHTMYIYVHIFNTRYVHFIPAYADTHYQLGGLKQLGVKSLAQWLNMMAPTTEPPRPHNMWYMDGGHWDPDKDTCKTWTAVTGIQIKTHVIHGRRSLGSNYGTRRIINTSQTACLLRRHQTSYIMKGICTMRTRSNGVSKAYIRGTAHTLNTYTKWEHHIHMNKEQIYLFFNLHAYQFMCIL
jgi:hypothetical protein